MSPVGNYTWLETFWLKHCILFLPHLKTHEVSIPVSLFPEDAKANHIWSFFRGKHDFVFPEDKHSTLLYKSVINPKSQTSWDLRRPQCKVYFFNVLLKALVLLNDLMNRPVLKIWLFIELAQKIFWFRS